MHPHPSWHYNLYLEIALQRRHVVLEGFQARGRDAADGAGLFALEGFLHFDVACCRQFVDLHTQVARRGSRLLLDIRELGFLRADQQRHHGQSQLRVQQWV